MKHGYPKWNLFYNNDVITKLTYICDNCSKEITTSWDKYYEYQIMKNKCVCRRCMTIRTFRERLLDNMSTIQRIVSNYLKNTKKLEIVDEYLIESIDSRYSDLNFIFIDICIPNKKIAIEVLGDYYHKEFIDYYFNNKKYDDIISSLSDEGLIKHLSKEIQRDKFLRDENWNILYLTETQILKEDWINIIENFLIITNKN